MSAKFAAPVLRAAVGQPTAARGRWRVRNSGKGQAAPGARLRAPAPVRTFVTALLGALCLSAVAAAATPPGTRIDNQALARFETVAGTPVTIASNVASVVTVFGRTPSQVTFTRIAPGAAGRNETVGPVQCR